MSSSTPPKRSTPLGLRRRDAASAEAGFSLLEMLVAMTLLAMIGAVAVSGLRFGSRAWERGAEAGETAVESRAVQKFLRGLIAGARLIRLRDSSRTPPALFDGEPDRLVFAAPLPAHLAEPGDHLLWLAAERRGGGGALALRWARIGASLPGVETASAPERLLDGVAAVALRYYGVDPETGRRGWTDAWRGRERLPELVELTVRWPEEDGRVWAPVVARLESGGEP